MFEFFREFRLAQESFVRSLAQVCTDARVNYNKDTRNKIKIEKCRINVDVWGPNEGKVRVGIQIWLEGGYETMYLEQVQAIEDAFKGLLGKELFRQRGFDFSCYVHGVHIRSEDD